MITETMNDTFATKSGRSWEELMVNDFEFYQREQSMLSFKWTNQILDYSRYIFML